MKVFLQKLMSGTSLTAVEAEQALDEIMSGSAAPEQVAAFLGALGAKFPNAAEIVGAVRSMRKHAISVATARQDLIDTCGTGGDGMHTFNISTVNAIILAAAELGVSKHGNRSVSSQCGSADVLEQLGIPLQQTAETAQTALEQKNFAFLFAPSFHPAMKHVAPIRKSLGVRTLFNILGPLANPAPVKRQVIGVYDAKLLHLLAEALKALDHEEVLLVCGDDGLDEISLSAATKVAHLSHGMISYYALTPEDFGMYRAPLEAIKGGDAKVNAAIIRDILTGKEQGPKRHITIINAAASLVVSGLVPNIREGVACAEELIDTGKAFEKLQSLGAKPA